MLSQSPILDTAVNLDLNNATGFLPYMYYWQGQAKYQLQQYVEAITDFDEVIQLYPNNTTSNLPRTYYWRGQVKKQLGYLPETIKNFQIARQYGTEA